MSSVFETFVLAKAPRGDPGFVPWMITFAYFVCAGLCFWAGRKEKERSLGRGRRWHAPVFWFTLCGLLVALGFNKQLDLQSDLTEVGRSMARSEGWYENRRIFQAIFVVIFGCGAVAAVVGAMWFMRDLWRRYRIAFVGIIYLCTFVIIRAASFHHIDAWVTVNVGGLRRGWWLELAGIAVIAASAFAYRNLPRRKSR